MHTDTGIKLVTCKIQWHIKFDTSIGSYVWVKTSPKGFKLLNLKTKKCLPVDRAVYPNNEGMF